MTTAEQLANDLENLHSRTLAAHRAAAELRRLAAENESAHIVGIRQEREIMALEAENERLRVDAERYLFIRALYGPTGNQHEWEAMDWALLKGGQILDSEIDAAMKEQTL